VRPPWAFSFYGISCSWGPRDASEISVQISGGGGTKNNALSGYIGKGILPGQTMLVDSAIIGLVTLAAARPASQIDPAIDTNSHSDPAWRSALSSPNGIGNGGRWHGDAKRLSTSHGPRLQLARWALPARPQTGPAGARTIMRGSTTRLPLGDEVENPEPDDPAVESPHAHRGGGYLHRYQFSSSASVPGASSSRSSAPGVGLRRLDVHGRDHGAARPSHGDEPVDAFGRLRAAAGYSRLPYAARATAYYLQGLRACPPSQGFPDVSLVVARRLSIVAGRSLGMGIGRAAHTRLLVQFHRAQQPAGTSTPQLYGPSWRRGRPDMPSRIGVAPPDPLPALVALLETSSCHDAAARACRFGLARCCLGVLCFGGVS